MRASDAVFLHTDGQKSHLLWSIFKAERSQNERAMAISHGSGAHFKFYLMVFIGRIGLFSGGVVCYGVFAQTFSQKMLLRPFEASN